jgi:general secretion pathway protein A
MYLNFYNLKKEPFQITPDPSFLYLSPGHKEALASIIYGVEKKKGFVLIIGAVGVGKTTILRAYLEKAEKERLRVIYLFNSNISYANLLRYIFRELNVVQESDDVSNMVSQLYEVLVQEYKEGRTVLLLIDEVQNMPLDTLENLRMLSNLETATEKLIQIVFSGQPEFEKTLNLQELKQLKQRIAVKAVITPLTNEEGLTYIRHRLKRAADKESVIFTKFALREIVRTARGIPRVINVLCDNSLITAFGYGKKKVGVGVVNEITRDFGMKRPWKIALHTAVWSAALTILAVYFVLTHPVGRKISKSFRAVGISAPSAPAPRERKEGTAQEMPKPKERQQEQTSADGSAYVQRKIMRGDTLARMIMDVYGHVDSGMIRLVKNANPHINDENLIVEGGDIRFPVKKGN